MRLLTGYTGPKERDNPSGEAGDERGDDDRDGDHLFGPSIRAGFASPRHSRDRGDSVEAHPGISGLI